ncbi:MAG: prepilin-type N-terminal cleavage/methylation domain-containing protein, partial [Tepidisphaeraceae bacterium]
FRDTVRIMSELGGSCMSDSMRRRAYTLVELLVAIGIIVVLIGLLLPVVSRARRQAIATQCASNLHQLYLAQMAHADDNRGRYTTVEFGAITDKWIMRLSKYMSRTGQPPDAVMYCPSTPGEDVQPRTDFLPPTMSYGMNSHVMMRNWQARRAAKMDASRIIVMGDKPCNYDDYLLSEDGVYFAPYTEISRDGDGWQYQLTSHRGSISRRHNGMANMLMADGHVGAFDAGQLKIGSGHWFWGEPKVETLKIGFCPCCPTP